MRKGLFLLIFVAPCFAEGPQYRHRDKTTNLEFQNVYQDLRAVRVTSTTLPSGSTQYIQNVNETGTNQANSTFNVSSGTVLTEFNVGSGGSIFKARSTGEITQPLQPSFLVNSASAQTDATGDGTTVTVVFGTEIFDQGSDFASNTFTAPVTGRYLLIVSIDLDQLSTANHSEVQINIVTSNRTYSHNFSDIPTSLTRTQPQTSSLADMDINDTATATVTVSGASKVVDIGSGLLTRFSGSLIN